MANLKAPLFSLDARGTIANAISFVKRRGQKIAEVTPFPKDAKTSCQLAWRTMYQLCVDLWHTLTPAEKLSWESAARPHHLTGYQWYMSQCLRPNPGIYLPLLGGIMTGSIAMSANSITGLSNPVNPQDAVTKLYHDALANLVTHGHAQHTDITRKLFIPATSGHLVNGISSNPGLYGVFYNTANLKVRSTHTFQTPADFVSFTSISALWATPAAAGNMYWRGSVYYAADTEGYAQHVESPAFMVTPSGGVNIFTVTNTGLSLVNLSLGDFIGFEFYRDGTHVADTLDDTLYFFGLIFEYIGHQ